MQSHSNNRQAHKGNINHNNVNFFNITKKSFQFYLGEAKHKYCQMDGDFPFTLSHTLANISENYTVL